MDPGPDLDPAEHLLDELRAFTDGLAAPERRLLAALLAPGIAAAWGPDPEASPANDRHRGPPTIETWTPPALPEHLAAVIRGRDLRVEGW